MPDWLDTENSRCHFSRCIGIRIGWVLCFSVLLLAICSGTPAAAAGPQQAEKKEESKTTPPAAKQLFAEADAARLMDGLRAALEANSQRRLLRLFDAARMPNYATFRDQVTEFFENYQAFQVHYHITEVSTEGENNVVVADLEIEATPSNANVPNVRRKTQLHLLVAWDGKQWKIVDLAPREFFS